MGNADVLHGIRFEIRLGTCRTQFGRFCSFTNNFNSLVLIRACQNDGDSVRIFPFSPSFSCRGHLHRRLSGRRSAIGPRLFSRAVSDRKSCFADRLLLTPFLESSLIGVGFVSGLGISDLFGSLRMGPFDRRDVCHNALSVGYVAALKKLGHMRRKENHYARCGKK